jgi:hypothetical protein
MITITAKTEEGLKRRIILNETVLMLNKNDTLSFEVKDEKVRFKKTINFSFSNDGDELSTTGNVADGGKVINIVLHKWDNSVGAEITEPIELKTENNKKVWLKFKTGAQSEYKFRFFNLTIWVEDTE